MRRNKLLSFGKGGIHPDDMKLTKGSMIQEIGLPRRVCLNLSQSIGKPAKETVKTNDHVTRGQLVGEAQGAISANLHTPISGTIKSVSEMRGVDGKPQRSIIIEASDEDHFADLAAICDTRPAMQDQEALSLSRAEIITAIKEAGIVGLGGATFPTAPKLTPPPDTEIDTLLINGTECEPYLTCDDAIMREMPEEIMLGIALLQKASGAKETIIGIEANKPDAIRRMADAAQRYDDITVCALKTRYPQGGEKMLIKALTGREVAPGKLPSSAGVIVQNAATSLAVYHAVVWKIPLIERVVTISGKGLDKRGNYRVPIGTELSELANVLGGVPENCVKLIAGGPMMGKSLASLEGSTTKGMNGLLFLSQDETKISEEQPCVRCGRCVESCPMGLQPYLISRLSELSMVKEAMAEGLMNCLECGCCSFSCIASRRLVDRIKTGKMLAREINKPR